MSLLSVSELQAQVETDLDATTLQQIIDAVERTIEDYTGPVAGYLAEYDVNLSATTLRLPVQATTIISIEEYTGSETEPTITILETDDYDLSDDNWNLRRLSDGTNPRSTWSWHIVVTFDPREDTERRKQIAIHLSRLEIEKSAYESESIGDWNSKGKNDKEVNTILRVLDNTLID